MTFILKSSSIPENFANKLSHLKMWTTHILFFQFVFEGMEESGSEGLDDLIVAKKDTFFKVC